MTARPGPAMTGRWCWQAAPTWCWPTTCADLTVVRLANTGITVDGDILRAEAGAVWDDVVVTALAHGLGGLECLSGIPGLGGRDAGAERRRLRRRGRRHHPPGPAARPGAPERTAGSAAANSDSVTGTSVLKHSDAAIVLEVEFALDADGRSAPLRYGELTAALGAEPGARADPAAGARRGAGAAGSARAWCSTRPTTTRGASARSSPTRSSRPTEFDRLQGRVGRARAQLPGAGRREAGRGLAGRARRLRQGLSG